MNFILKLLLAHFPSIITNAIPKTIWVALWEVASERKVWWEISFTYDSSFLLIVNRSLMVMTLEKKVKRHHHRLNSNLGLFHQGCSWGREGSPGGGATSKLGALPTVSSLSSQHWHGSFPVSIV